MADTVTTPSSPVPLANPKIFNNEEDSNIIITFNGQKIYAHRIILRMWSPFFERALTSNFPVAQSDTFSLGDDDNPEAIWAMLRHMYHFEYAFGTDLNTDNALDYHIDVYEIADKYDCPSLRGKAIQNFINCMKLLEDQSVIGKSVPIISRLCGPAASHPANSEIRILVVEFFYYHSETLVENLAFIEALAAGNLFDAVSTKDFLTSVLFDNVNMKATAHFCKTKQSFKASPADKAVRQMARNLGGDESPFAG